jgi:hypothetical protein
MPVQNPFKTKPINNIHCLVIGEDKTLTHQYGESTGVHVLFHKTRTGYDSFPNAIANYTKAENGQRLFLGPHCIVFEPMSRPWSFSDGTWAKIKHKKEVICTTALHEGCSMAIQQQNVRERFNKVANILFLVCGILILIAFLVAHQSGALPHIHF